jgi:hypothetical protein
MKERGRTVEKKEYKGGEMKINKMRVRCYGTVEREREKRTSFVFESFTLSCLCVQFTAHIYPVCVHSLQHTFILPVCTVYSTHLSCLCAQFTAHIYPVCVHSLQHTSILSVCTVYSTHLSKYKDCCLHNQTVTTNKK